MNRARTIRHGAVQICVSLMLMRGVTANAKEMFVAEPWVKQCKIQTGEIWSTEAADVAGGIKVQKLGNGGHGAWAPEMGPAKGVLVIHPMASDKPAEIEFNLKGALDPSKLLRIVARGADASKGPGVKLAIVAKRKPIKEVTLGEQWTTIEIPLSDLPGGTQSVTLRVVSIGWFFEYCYIDSIEVSK